jgi:hypothetical protein
MPTVPGHRLLFHASRTTACGVDLVHRSCPCRLPFIVFRDAGESRSVAVPRDLPSYLSAAFCPRHVSCRISTGMINRLILLRSYKSTSMTKSLEQFRHADGGFFLWRRAAAHVYPWFIIITLLSSFNRATSCLNEACIHRVRLDCN